MRRNAVFLLGVLLVEVSAFAQTNPPPPPVASQASQLPLSGRNPQNGAVNAVQLPVPGTTTSVDTLNPAIQVQGPYTGSFPSGSAVPFDGKLSFRNALERGIEYNLGPIGMNEILRQAQGQAKINRSIVLPNISASVIQATQQTNLQTVGLRLSPT